MPVRAHFNAGTVINCWTRVKGIFVYEIFIGENILFSSPFFPCFAAYFNKRYSCSTGITNRFLWLTRWIIWLFETDKGEKLAATQLFGTNYGSVAG